MQFVKKYNEFLTEDLYKECIETARKLLNSPSQCFSTNRFWDYDIVKDSFPVIIHSINTDTQLYNRLKDEILTKIKSDLEGKQISIQENPEFLFYYWTRYSYIPWHNDAKHYAALTIYLNEVWHPDWGGYFMYMENGIDTNTIKAIMPKKNNAMLQYGGVYHTTTAVNFDGETRITLQVFFPKERI